MNDYAQRLRSRIEYEDGLLNTRTGIFLLSNSLLGVAIQMDKPQNSQYVIILFSIAICILWTIVGRKQMKIIKNLTVRRLKKLKKTPDKVEQIVQDSSKKLPIFLRPTNILAIWLPWLTFLAWIGILIFRILNSLS